MCSSDLLITIDTVAWLKPDRRAMSFTETIYFHLKIITETVTAAPFQEYYQLCQSRAEQKYGYARRAYYTPLRINCLMVQGLFCPIIVRTTCFSDCTGIIEVITRTTSQYASACTSSGACLARSFENSSPAKRKSKVDLNQLSSFSLT